MSGRLEVICGPMFSGKTEELLRRVRRAEVARLPTVLVRASQADSGDTAALVTHAGRRLDARPIVSAAELQKVVFDAAVVGVDDVHLLDAGAGLILNALVLEGRLVVAAGLDRDAEASPFPPMPLLLALADRVDKLHAVCQRCGRDAYLTRRTEDGYEARCRECFEARRS